MFAIFKGNARIVKQLIDKGANVKARDNEGTSVFLYACGFGDGNIIRMLLVRDRTLVNDKTPNSNINGLHYAASLNNLEKVSDIVPVSCLKNKNIDTLIQLLKKYVPEVDENQRYFDQDMYTDKSVKFIASEIIREKALYFLDKEIPHGIAVSITKFEEIDKLINIDADIICEKQSHKNIIIGKSGNMLKRIGHEARVSIQKVVQCKVNLNLWVKVKENWRNNSGFLNEIGYNNSDLS